MSRIPRIIANLFFFLSFLLAASPLFAQEQKATSASGASTALTVEKSFTLAEQGHCKEAVPALKRAMTTSGPVETRKRAGVLGLRCSLELDNRDSVLDFLRVLGKQFPQDPDILFIVVHAYSDLSTRAAQDLGRTAPQSIPAHKLNAEALEMQGRWDEAQHEYETMIAKEPNATGLHYLLGRLFLSRPEADAKVAERAKQEFQKELEIDPKNAGAHYVLGQLATKGEHWDDAVTHFSETARLDPSFAQAYLGWGFCLVTLQRYQEAIAPLRAAERLMPENPTIHYTLSTALSHSGQKEEAEKELEIHRRLMPPTSPATDTPL